MRFLIDMALSPGMAEFLEGLGHDAVHARDLNMSRATDAEIAERARDEERVVVTADLDFPQLLALSGAGSPGVILFRGGTYSVVETNVLIQKLLQSEYADDLNTAITVLDHTSVRLTKLPIERNS